MMSQIHCLCIHCRLVTADQLPVLDVESKSSSTACQVLNVHYTVHVCLSSLSTYRLHLVRFLFQTVCDYTSKIIKHNFLSILAPITTVCSTSSVCTSKQTGICCCDGKFVYSAWCPQNSKQHVIIMRADFTSIFIAASTVSSTPEISPTPAHTGTDSGTYTCC